MVGVTHSGKLCLHLSELGTGPGKAHKTKESFQLRAGQRPSHVLCHLWPVGLLDFYNSVSNTETYTL